jgi:hypothetical protein
MKENTKFSVYLDSCDLITLYNYAILLEEEKGA